MFVQTVRLRAVLQALDAKAIAVHGARDMCRCNDTRSNVQYLHIRGGFGSEDVHADLREIHVRFPNLLVLDLTPQDVGDVPALTQSALLFHPSLRLLIEPYYQCDNAGLQATDPSWLVGFNHHASSCFQRAAGKLVGSDRGLPDSFWSDEQAQCDALAW